MTRLLRFAFCVWPLAVPFAVSGAEPAPDCTAVPGWTMQGPARSYSADNLFEYMDGNAEGYLIYKFVKMTGITCVSGESQIIFDISEMADPESAYGIFAANRDPNAPTEKIGMAGQITQRKAVFVKDKYYIELAANPAKDHSPVLRSFVAAFETRISGRTELPEELGWFPKDGLQADSVRLVPESVLGLRLLKRGYVGQYDFAKGFVVKEASPEAAAAVMEKLRARIGQVEAVKVADDGFQATDRYLSRLCFFRKGKYLGGFANVKEGQDPMTLATKLAAQIP
jgi:hypothetical protein